MASPIAGLVFDVYGTLLDVHAVGPMLDAHFPGKGAAIAARWRLKQIDYAWLRTLSDRYVDFSRLTSDALDYACEFEGAALKPDARSALLGFYAHLPPHPEVTGAVQKIGARGLPLAVLSNGDGGMLEEALSASSLRAAFAHVLSADKVRKFKTAAEVYQLAVAAFGRPAGELLFVSSNGWDAAGAAWFGYRTYWINRAGAPRERLDAPIEAVGRTMDDLVAYLETA